MPSQTLKFPPRLYLRDGRRVLCVPTEEIVWVEAAGNYVQIHTAKKTHLVRHTVKAMATKLDPQHFVRVRPSAIVARTAVTALNARHGGDYLVVLASGTEIRSSRGFRDEVEAALADSPGSARSVLASRRRRRTARATPVSGPTTADASSAASPELTAPVARRSAPAPTAARSSEGAAHWIPVPA